MKVYKLKSDKDIRNALFKIFGPPVRAAEGGGGGEAPPLPLNPASLPREDGYEQFNAKKCSWCEVRPGIYPIQKVYFGHRFKYRSCEECRNRFDSLCSR